MKSKKISNLLRGGGIYGIPTAVQPKSFSANDYR